MLCNQPCLPTFSALRQFILQSRVSCNVNTPRYNVTCANKLSFRNLQLVIVFFLDGRIRHSIGRCNLNTILILCVQIVTYFKIFLCRRIAFQFSLLNFNYVLTKISIAAGYLDVAGRPVIEFEDNVSRETLSVKETSSFLLYLARLPRYVPVAFVRIMHQLRRTSRSPYGPRAVAGISINQRGLSRDQSRVRGPLNRCYNLCIRLAGDRAAIIFARGIFNP